MDGTGGGARGDATARRIVAHMIRRRRSKGRLLAKAVAEGGGDLLIERRVAEWAEARNGAECARRILYGHPL